MEVDIMKRILSVAAFVMCFTLSLMLVTPALGSHTEYLTANEYSWFEQHGVDLSNVAGALMMRPQGTAMLRSIMLQAKAYSFTPEQVKANVQGLLAAPSSAFQGVYGRLSEDGSTFTLPNGTTTPNLLARWERRTPATERAPETGVGLLNFTSDYRDVVDFNDQTGVFWLVKGRPGYDQSTAFVNLPHITTVPTSPDRPYFYFAVNNSTSSVVGDYGIVYYPASGWHLFSNTLVWNADANKYNQTWWNSSTPLPSQYVGGSSLYLHVQITNTAATDSVTITLRDGNTFAVLFSRTVSFANNPFNASLSNVNIFRQITMAQDKPVHALLNTNTGTQMDSARFSNAFLYSPTGFWSWGTGQTADAFRKAPTLRQLATVTVNAYTKWSAENISIRFNVP